MADDPDFSDITIRNPETGEEKTIAKPALPFFPDFVRVDSIGRQIAPAAPAPAANDKSKEH